MGSNICARDYFSSIYNVYDETYRVCHSAYQEEQYGQEQLGMTRDVVSNRMRSYRLLI